MPMYTYKCPECGRVTDALNKIDDRAIGPICHDQHMRQVITAPMIQPVMGGGSFQGYHCPVTDKFVTSRKERTEIMKSHNLVEKG